jgi:hypothetical protein
VGFSAADIPEWVYPWMDKRGLAGLFQGLDGWCAVGFHRLSSKALLTTDTELSAMAAPANMGLR